MGLDLKAIRDKQTNLNAQEIGDDKQRAQGLAAHEDVRGDEEHNPVFDQDEVHRMVKAGLAHLADVQCSDGGWGWFGGDGEQSYPHTTALIVHGLQLARANKVALAARTCWSAASPGCSSTRPSNWPSCSCWDQTKQRRQISRRTRWMPSSTWCWSNEKHDNPVMRDYLYRDRNDLPVYAKSMFALALNTIGDTEKRDMLRQNIEQYLVQDDENQTAYLKLPENNWWWCWYGSEYEAQAYYLKLLTARGPARRDRLAPGEIPAQQPQARQLLEQHARYRHRGRSHGRLPAGQRRGQAGYDA